MRHEIGNAHDATLNNQSRQHVSASGFLEQSKSQDSLPYTIDLSIIAYLASVNGRLRRRLLFRRPPGAADSFARNQQILLTTLNFARQNSKWS